MNDDDPHPHRPRFTYSVVASPLHDDDAVGALTAPVRTRLGSAGGRETPVGADSSRPHLLVIATGGTERAVLELVERRRVASPWEPTILVAHRGHNSLPAALEALAALQQAGSRGRIAYLGGSDADDLVIEQAVTDLQTVHRFHSTRLGLVGGPSDWLVASSPPPEIVRRRWGPTVEIVDPDRLRAARRRTDPTFTEVLEPVGTSRSLVSLTALAESAAVGSTLREVVEEEQLDAITVRCFDLLSDPGTSGCLALASLNDAGVVAGCEGDIPSTLGMMLIRFLLDQPSWMANPARIDLEANDLVLAHCTVAPSMVEDLTLSTHFESGIGVGIAGRFARQPVTLVRVGGLDLGDCWIAEGQIVSSGQEPDLCRTQVTVHLDDRPVGELLTRPLGNHLVLARGHHRGRLDEWWSMTISDQ